MEFQWKYHFLIENVTELYIMIPDDHNIVRKIEFYIFTIITF